MRDARAVAVAGAAAIALLAGACTAGTRNDPPVPDDSALTRSTHDALALLAKSPLKGHQPKPVASGHDRADDKGHEVSEPVKGRALFQIVCSGSGRITVTMPRQHLSKLVRCGEQASGFRFRGPLVALVVGQRDSDGAYAWRILGHLG